MTIITHGTFALYTAVAPPSPPEPTQPSMVPPLDPDADAEQQAEHAAAMAAYGEASTQYEAEMVAWRAEMARVAGIAEKLRTGCRFARRADDADFYDVAGALPDGRNYCTVVAGVVTSTADRAAVLGVLDGMTLIETDLPVAGGWTWDGTTLAPPPGPTLAEVKAARIAAAWAEQDRRLTAYIVNVTIGGMPRPFGCDPVSRENIIGINALISQEMAGLLPVGTVPNPRGFTPKGQSVPVLVTHAEFALIGASMAGAKDAHFVAYATHKAAINALTEAEAVADYDIMADWPV